MFQAVQEQAVISRDELIATAYFLLDAIERMNDVGVLHRDVKPENLLVNNSVKPFDFETAVIGQRRGSELVREFPGTTRIVSSLRTTSPEVLQSARIYNDLSEAWSTGMCLYYLAYGVYPFLATNSPMIQHLRITQDKFEYPEKANVPKGLLRVIKSLLNPDKDSRANIKKARKKVGRLL